MILRNEDIERIGKALQLHSAFTSKHGGCEFFSMVVKDSNKNPIGTVENDDYGNSCFKEIGKK